MTMVRLYAAFRRLVGQSAIDVAVSDGATVGDILRRLAEMQPALSERMLDEKGQVRRFVNVFVNGRDIRYLKGMDTPVRPGDEVAIFPPVAGGQGGVAVLLS